MICVSFLENDYDKLIDQISSVEFAEIRLDDTEFSFKQLKKLFSMPAKIIATCRSGKFTDSERIDILKYAVSSGVDYVDIDIRNSDNFIKNIISYTKKEDCKLILSFHEYDKCPPSDELNEIVRKCFFFGM